MLRNIAYEIFFLTHVGLAGLLASTVWLHLERSRSSSRLYVVGAVALLVASTVIRAGHVIARNARLSGQTHQQSRLTRLSAESGAEGIVRIELRLARPMKVMPGQHIYIYVPWLGMSSWFQSHPFTVVSWSTSGKLADREMAEHLELFVRPRMGWT